MDGLNRSFFFFLPDFGGCKSKMRAPHDWELDEDTVHSLLMSTQGLFLEHVQREASCPVSLLLKM